MTNESFSLLSQEEKNRKFRAVLNSRTAGNLTSREVECIMHSISMDKQYRILVYDSYDALMEYIQLADNYQCELVLGKDYIPCGHISDEEKCLTEPVVIISHHQIEMNKVHELHIFISNGNGRKEIDNREQ